MAGFTNFATLSYNGGTTNSNIVTGEILEFRRTIRRETASPTLSRS